MSSKWGARLTSLRGWILMAVLRLLEPDILWGVAGGLLAYFATNVWFYYLGAWPLPGMPPHRLMPGFLSFLSIDVYVGAGCGFAGYRAGRELALLLGYADREARRVPRPAALMLATIIALFVNLVRVALKFI